MVKEADYVYNSVRAILLHLREFYAKLTQYQSFVERAIRLRSQIRSARLDALLEQNAQEKKLLSALLKTIYDHRGSAAYSFTLAQTHFKSFRLYYKKSLFTLLQTELQKARNTKQPQIRGVVVAAELLLTRLKSLVPLMEELAIRQLRANDEELTLIRHIIHPPKRFVLFGERKDMQHYVQKYERHTQEEYRQYVAGIRLLDERTRSLQALAQKLAIKQRVDMTIEGTFLAILEGLTVGPIVVFLIKPIHQLYERAMRAMPLVNRLQVLPA